MGMFKDLRNIQKQSKEMQKEQGGRPSIKDALAQGSQAMDNANQMMADQELRQSGRDGEATVVAIRDTGVTMNENPVVEFDLKVTVGGFGPYDVTRQQIISRLQMGQIQPGAELQVKVAEDDPQRVLIV